MSKCASLDTGGNSPRGDGELLWDAPWIRPTVSSRLGMLADFRESTESATYRSGRFSEVRLQLADELVPDFLRQIVGHSVDQHQPRALDGVGDGAPTGGAHQPVGLAVDHDGRRGDLAVVVPQAAAAEHRGEVPRDARGVVGALVALDRVGPQLLLGSRIARAADDRGHPYRVGDDRLLRGVRRPLQKGPQLLGTRW